MLIDAIMGRAPNMTMCAYLEKMGVMRFTGNQHNPDWSWDRNKLEALDEPVLKTLYRNCGGEI